MPPMSAPGPERMSRRMVTLLAAYLLVVQSTLVSASASAPACYAGSGTLQWYIDAVGENPCMTYQRLRQTCNSNYTTPTWTINGNTDQCDDPLSTCCCNSIAWSLRMLCINCEWDENGAGDIGHSATAGAYYQYRWSSGVPNSGMYCGDGYNQTLPQSLQLAICNKGIGLSDFLYSIFWPDGSWDFTTFESVAQQTLASNNNQSLDLCPSNTSSPTGGAGIPTSRTSPAQTSANGKVDTATVAVVGGALGGTLGLVLLGVGVVALVLYSRRRRRVRVKTMVDDDDRYKTSSAHSMQALAPVQADVITPFFDQPRGMRFHEQLASASLGDTRTGSELNLVSQASYALPTSLSDGLDADPSRTPSSSNNQRKEKGNRIQHSTQHRVTSQSTDLHERDAGVSMQDSRLPPEYRTVYSG